MTLLGFGTKLSLLKVFLLINLPSQPFLRVHIFFFYNGLLGATHFLQLSCFWIRFHSSFCRQLCSTTGDSSPDIQGTHNINVVYDLRGSGGATPEAGGFFNFKVFKMA